MNRGDRNTIPWRDNGIWLVGDTHMHYRNVGVERLAAEAAPFCDFIVVTSHSHRPNFWRPQHRQIKAARKKFPNLMIFHGLEWACPVGNHATVIAGKSRSENAVLARFWKTYDRWYAPAKPSTLEDAIAGLRFLETQSRKAEAVVMLNHPSSGQPYTIESLRALADASDLCIGFEGAPGNQSRRPGSEIDPMVERVGGELDLLLSEGRRWTIVAPSDFHSHVSEGGKTYWPGEFAKTVVCCPERSYRGVLAGLRSGAVYFVHNDIIGPLRLSATAGDRRAVMGETLVVCRGDRVDIALDCIERSEIDRVEFISNYACAKTARVSKRTRRREVGPWSRFTFSVARAMHSFFVRARGVAANQAKPCREDRGEMWFYTNAIYVEVM